MSWWQKKSTSGPWEDPTSRFLLSCWNLIFISEEWTGFSTSQRLVVKGGENIFSNKLTQPILFCYSCTRFVCNENTGRLISAADTLSLSCRGHRQCLPVLPIKKAMSLAAVRGFEYRSWRGRGIQTALYNPAMSPFGDLFTCRFFFCISAAPTLPPPRLWPATLRRRAGVTGPFRRPHGSSTVSSSTPSTNSWVAT